MSTRGTSADLSLPRLKRPFAFISTSAFSAKLTEPKSPQPTLCARAVSRELETSFCACVLGAPTEQNSSDELVPASTSTVTREI